MIGIILSFISKKPLFGGILVALVSGLIFSAISGGVSYFKGRSDGRTLANAACDAGKAKAVESNLEIKEKNDAARNNRPSGLAVIDVMHDGRF
jgi:hypothetical protein